MRKLTEPSPRDKRILLLRRCGDTLEQIGAEMGISHEWVRRICKRWGVTSPKPIRLTNHHSLADGGVKYCPICKEHKRLDKFSPDPHGAHGVKGRCKACLAARKRAAYHAGPPKEYHKAYYQTERGQEVQRRAMERYRAKQKESLRTPLTRG